MAAKVYVLQHHRVEVLGRIADALEEAALAWQYVRVFDGAPVPADMKGAGGLILMGGPISVYETDKYPYLGAEFALVNDAIARGLPVLGVCLGAQIVAAALGAEVKPNRAKEIGWHPARLEASASGDPLFGGVPESFTSFHWHGDIFDLPRGAVSLARSELTPCQAFRYGDHVYALQLHLEVTPEIVETWIRTWPGDVKRAGLDGDAIIAETPRHIGQLNRIGDRVFSRWAQPLQRR